VAGLSKFIFVLFFGLGLKPFLEKQGYMIYIGNSQKSTLTGVWSHHRKENGRNGSKKRNDKYRRSRKKDPRLPKNW